MENAIDCKHYNKDDGSCLVEKKMKFWCPFSFKNACKDYEETNTRKKRKE